MYKSFTPTVKSSRNTAFNAARDGWSTVTMLFPSETIERMPSNRLARRLRCHILSPMWRTTGRLLFIRGGVSSRNALSETKNVRCLLVKPAKIDP
jgi:hypothetical protein